MALMLSVPPPPKVKVFRPDKLLEMVLALLDRLSEKPLPVTATPMVIAWLESVVKDVFCAKVSGPLNARLPVVPPPKAIVPKL